jgi:hypothetical protein
MPCSLRSVGRDSTSPSPLVPWHPLRFPKSPASRLSTLMPQQRWDQPSLGDSIPPALQAGALPAVGGSTNGALDLRSAEFAPTTFVVPRGRVPPSHSWWLERALEPKRDASACGLAP